MKDVGLYINDVLSGAIPACKTVRKAVERHVFDLEHAHTRGLYFDPGAAQHAIDFFAFLKHSKGEWANHVFTLSPWQKFVTASVFGWKRPDGFRRFRTVYTSVARKNGKSTWLSGIGLYCFLADREMGAEVYTAGTKLDQAKIIHSESVRMGKGSPAIRKRVKFMKNNLIDDATNSSFSPLGGDSKTLDGLNVHVALVDEIHAHPDRDLWDVLETATGARQQPLIWAITTRGYDKHSLCYELDDYTGKILDGIIDDDSFFGMIWGLDCDEYGEPLDDWKSPAAWQKANPNWEVSVKPDDIARLCAQAQEIPSKQNAFKRLRLNIWTQSSVKWLLSELWSACGTPVDAERLRGRRCYGAIDLSSTKDLTAWGLVFPPITDDGLYEILVRFFVPQDSIADRVKTDRVPYDQWVRQGFIIATPGAVVNYEFVKKQILEDVSAFDIADIAFDPWQATQIAVQLQGEGLELVEFRQGYKSMSPAVKGLEQAVLSKSIAHGGNPVLAWCIDNVHIVMDSAENVKMDKSKSTERIDGAVAVAMAHDRARRQGDGGKSVYETRGVLAF